MSEIEKKSLRASKVRNSQSDMIFGSATSGEIADGGLASEYLLLFRSMVIVPLFFLVTSCSSKLLVVDNSEKLLKVEKYEKVLNVKDMEASPEEIKTSQEGNSKNRESKGDTQQTQIIKGVPVKDVKKGEPSKKEDFQRSSQRISGKKVQLKKKYPSLEDSEGFDGRRPVVDPFHVGEKVTIKLSYFKIVAGTMDIEVLPFKEVNGRKSYHLKVSGKSNSLFSSFYAVDDQAETFLDYETLLPYNMVVDVKETKQLRTVRSFFDWKKKKASFWEKKITKKHGVEEKSFEWGIEPYSQNIFSAAFYLRTFTLEPGKTIQFRVADNKKNMIVKAHVLRRETIKTEVGELKTVVIQPEVQIEGTFKPMGDVFFWLTDDDRKFVVRIESKIKIGTIVGSVSEIKY